MRVLGHRLYGTQKLSQGLAVLSNECVCTSRRHSASVSQRLAVKLDRMREEYWFTAYGATRDDAARGLHLILDDLELEKFGKVKTIRLIPLKKEKAD